MTTITNNFTKIIAALVAVVVAATTCFTLVNTHASAASYTKTKYMIDTPSTQVLSLYDVNTAVEYAKSQVGNTYVTNAYARDNSVYHFESKYNCSQFIRSCFHGRTNTPYTGTSDPTYWADDWGIISTSMKDLELGSLCIWEGYVKAIARNTGHIAIVTGFNEHGEALVTGAGGTIVETMPVSAYSRKYTNMKWVGWTTYLGRDMQIGKKPMPNIDIANHYLYRTATISCEDATTIEIKLLDSNTLNVIATEKYTGHSAWIPLPRGKYILTARAKLSDGSYSEYTTYTF